MKTVQKPLGIQFQAEAVAIIFSEESVPLAITWGGVLERRFELSIFLFCMLITYSNTFMGF